MEDDDGAMEVVPVIAPTGEQAEHTRPGLSGTQADGSTGEERDPRPGVATGRSASVHTLSDISIRIVQCDYKLTRVREVPSVMLAENPDLPLRQPMPGQPGKTREAEVGFLLLRIELRCCRSTDLFLQVPVIRIFGPVRGSSMTSSGKVTFGPAALVIAFPNFISSTARLERADSVRIYPRCLPVLLCQVCRGRTPNHRAPSARRVFHILTVHSRWQGLTHDHPCCRQCE